MKECKKCDGEGILIKDRNATCTVCSGMGVVGVPSTIYLQLSNLDEVTWCVDRIDDSDLEYTIVPPNKPLHPAQKVGG